MADTAEKHVEHLRVVHFALMITSLVLLAVTYLLRGPDGESAYRSLSEIHYFVTANYPRQEHFLKKHVNERLAHALNEQPGIADEFLPGRIQFGAGYGREEHISLLSFGDAGISGSGGKRIARWITLRDIVTPDISNMIRGNNLSGVTLKKFMEFWDALYEADQVFLPKPRSKVIAFDEAAGKFELVPWRLPEKGAAVAEPSGLLPLRLIKADPPGWLGQCSGFPAANTDLELRVNELGGGFALCPQYFDVRGREDDITNKRNTIVVPVDVVTVDVKLLKNFIEMSGNKHWRARSFRFAFPDVWSVVSNRQGILDIDFTKSKDVFDLFPLIGKEEKLNAFGVNVNVAAAREWGSVIVFGIQVYFLLHLMAFREQLARGAKGAWDYPWIVLYRNPLARLTTYVSALALPLGTIAVLLGLTWLLGHDSAISVVLSVVVAPGAVAVAFFTWRCLRDLWRIKPEAPQEVA